MHPSASLDTIPVFAPVAAPPDAPPGRRAEGRQVLTVRAEVIPLGEGFLPLAEPAEAVTLDISGRGIGLAADVPEGVRYFLMRFRATRGRVVERLYEVRSCEPFGLVRKLGGVLVTD